MIRSKMNLTKSLKSCGSTRAMSWRRENQWQQQKCWSKTSHFSHSIDWFDFCVVLRENLNFIVALIRDRGQHNETMQCETHAFFASKTTKIIINAFRIDTIHISFIARQTHFPVSTGRRIPTIIFVPSSRRFTCFQCVSAAFSMAN